VRPGLYLQPKFGNMMMFSKVDIRFRAETEVSSLRVRCFLGH
jgi:hypothetical protein